VEQDVKEERSQRQFVAQLLHVDAAAESSHGVLKGERPAVSSQHDHFAVENHLAAGKRPHRRHHPPNGARHLIQTPRIHRDAIAARRPLSAGIPLALATASNITPSRAPCLTSPTNSPPRKFCSAVVARENKSPSSRTRSAPEFLPRTLVSAEKTESTSCSSSVA